MSTEIKTLNFADGFQCNLCKRLFQTQRGRSAHLNHCLKKQKSSSVAALRSSCSGQPESFVIGSNEKEFETPRLKQIFPKYGVFIQKKIYTRFSTQPMKKLYFGERMFSSYLQVELEKSSLQKLLILSTCGTQNLWK